MNERDLFRALSDIDDDLIAGVAEESARKRPIRLYLSTALAACLCVVFLFVALRSLPTNDQTNSSGDAQIQNTHSDGSTQADTRPPRDATEEPQGGEITGFTTDPNRFGITPPASDSQPTGANENAVNGYNPTGATSKVPQDFSFTLTWGDQSYDSAKGIFTDSDGQSLTLHLTDAEMEQAWTLLSGLTISGSPAIDGIHLTYVLNGQTIETTVSERLLSNSLTVCTTLIDMIESAANRVR